MRFPKLLVLLLGFSFFQGITSIGIATSAPTTHIKQNAPSPSAKISEADIQALLAALKTAAKTRDITGVVQYYAPFVSSELTIKAGSSSETIQLDGLKEHRTFLENAYQGIKDVEVLSESAEVDILASNEMAMIHQQRTVAITATDGKRYLLDSTSVTKVAPVDGRLKIVAVEETVDVGQIGN